MLQLEDGELTLSLDEQRLCGEIRLKAGGDLWTFDLRRARWQTRPASGAGAAGNAGTPAATAAPDWKPFPHPSNITQHNGEIALRYVLGGGQVRASIRLVHPGPAVEFSLTPLSWGDDAVAAACFPGSVWHAEGPPTPVAIPTYQGLLYTGRGEPFTTTNPGQGLRMRWWGVLGQRSSYLAIIETPDDTAFHLAKDEHGRVHSQVEWLPSLDELTYERRVVYHFKPGVSSYVPLAKHFRAYAKRNGLYRSWREKREERPAVDRLLGAAHLFLGYQAGEGLDYLGSLRRLKALGLERAFCFPLYFCNFGTPFVIKGVEAIAQRDIVETVQNELGYLCSPWAWNWEILTRDPDYSPELIIKERSGRLNTGWRIEEDAWQRLNQRKATELFKKYAPDYLPCDAFHFDVTTSHPLMEDRDLRRPYSRTEDRRARTDMFDWLTQRGKVVGSEGFWDWAAAHMDYGTTKLAPAFGDERFWTIPLMELVYHDALVHVWWEVDAYNEQHCFTGRGGQPVAQSLQDVLYNEPPVLFPVGRQYYWVDRARHTVEFHAYDLETPGVMEAVKRGIAVAELHRRYAEEELLEHRFLNEDGSAQETVFASGVRFAVNFADRPAETAAGRLPPQSWVSA